MTHTTILLEQTTRWLEQVVIDLNLCPFARAPHAKGLVYIHACPAPTFEEAIDQILDQLDELLKLSSSERSTTLCVIPNALLDFDDFLDAIDTLEYILETSHADQLIQIAHFHPDYTFENTDPDDVSNYTNRSPAPIIHLIRAEEVADAITSTPRIHDIPENNINTLKDLGLTHMKNLLTSIKDQQTPS